MRIEVRYKKNLVQTIRYHDSYAQLNWVDCLHAQPFEGATKGTSAIHIHISFEHWQKFTPDMRNEIIKAYMQQAGMEAQPFFAYWYNSGDKHGLHIITTRLHEKEKLTILWVSRMNRKKEITEDLKRKFTVKHSDLLIKEPLHPHLLYGNPDLVYGKSLIHTTINSVVDNIIQGYKFNSLDSARKLINIFGITFSLVGEKLAYSILPSNGETAMPPVCETELIAAASLGSIKDRINSFNTHFFRSAAWEFRFAVNHLFSLTPLTLADFRTRMRDRGIRTLFENLEDPALEKIWFMNLSDHNIIDGESILDGDFTAAGIRKRCVPEGSYSAEEREKYLNMWSLPSKKDDTPQYKRPLHEIFG